MKRIRWSTDRDELASATRATLQLLLRRPCDRVLLETLLAQVAVITNALPRGQSQGSAIRQAAVRCVVLLQSAKKGRLTRAQNDQLSQKRHRRVMLVLASLVATAAIYLVTMLPSTPSGNLTGTQIAAAMEDALQHSRLGLTRRGDITIRATHDHIIVTAERLNPEDCVTAAHKIQQMGRLTINETEVGKAGDEKFSQLCYQMHDASLSITQTGYKP